MSAAIAEPTHAWHKHAPASPRGALSIIDRLLRDRAGIVARIQAGDDVAPIVRACVVTIAVAMAIVGAALGNYHGGIQIAYAALKLPLVILGTAALSGPALSAIGTALGRPPRLAADVALVTCALAFGAMLLAACTPLVLLAHAVDLGYHKTILLVVAMFSTAGLLSLSVIVRALAAETGPGRRAAVIGLCTVLALVGSQLSWSLRPYMSHPSAPTAPFVHPITGSLVDAVWDTLDSARRGVE